MTPAYEALYRRGALGDLDYHFARLVAATEQRLHPGADPGPIALAAALVSRAAGQGHVCLDLDDLSGGEPGDRELRDRNPEDPDPQRATPNGATPAPGASAADASPASWHRRLTAAATVGRPGDFRPLVLDGRRLYLYRHWDAERRVAAGLLARASADPPGPEAADVRAALAGLFPQFTAHDRQCLAAVVACHKRLCVVSGGPGTGKTHTVFRALALLGALSPRPLRVALAAPTGKAAARLQTSLRAARSAGGGHAVAVPDEAMTLHRLLGWRPGAGEFARGPGEPLDLDVLVVDEASMVDLSLMARLLAALPAEARLILLGDKDQLASVEAGAVLADMCGEAAGYSTAFAGRLRAVFGTDLPCAPAGPMADCVVTLDRSYRFESGSGLGRLAAATNAGDAAAARAALRDSGPDVAWEPAADTPELHRRVAGLAARGYARYCAQPRTASGAAALLAALDGFRVLTAHRGGPAGVPALNAVIERALARAHGLPAFGVWYPGRPVLVTRNDYGLRLYNGDVGVVLPDAGRLMAYFQTSDGGLRRVPVTRLPACETCFAMTVHKSQGSEFERVALVLPPTPSPVLSRELVYTGLTRARHGVVVVGGDAVLATALARRQRRASGLKGRLWGESPAAF